MPDFLLELFSEEIPARMQARAAEDLKKLVTQGMVDRGLTYAAAAAFATPRRLTLSITGMADRSPDVKEERKGPRTDAPEKALEGFLRSTGLTKDQLEARDDKKGQVWFAIIEKPGQGAAEVLADVIPDVIRNFPWPRSMRWGSGDLRWVRPLHSIMAIILNDNAANEVVDFEVGGIHSGDATQGHRFMGPEAFTPRDFDHYVKTLEAQKVILDPEERRNRIWHDATQMSFAQGMEVVEDQGLLAEVAGLVEWPVVLMGDIEDRFLGLPPEVLQTSMKEHQKFFSVRNPKTGRIEKFITVANIETADSGATILAGNQRVLAARLSDALFFWENDLRVVKTEGMEAMAAPLANVTFHNKLGSQAERIARIAALAREIAPLVGADADKAERAAKIAKADLSSEMVYEFPELQGIMGKYYAEAAGEDPTVAAACETHYAPLGPSDDVPTEPVAVAVSLADKIDILTGFWAIDEKPTGSKDPFALRRAALGVIRTIEANRARTSLLELFVPCFLGHLNAANRRTGYLLNYLSGLSREERNRFTAEERDIDFYREYPVVVEFLIQHERDLSSLNAIIEIQVEETDLFSEIDLSQIDFELQASEIGVGKVDDYFHLDNNLIPEFVERSKIMTKRVAELASLRVIKAQDYISTLKNCPEIWAFCDRQAQDLLAFFADRLKVHLRAEGVRHDVIDACFQLGGQDDLDLLVNRVNALQKFVETEDGANLLAGYKRAANILAAEQKKDGVEYTLDPDLKFAEQAEETALFTALDAAEAAIGPALEAEDFAAAMTAMAALRAPIDGFFDKVTVNADNQVVRRNRLCLLNRVKAVMEKVAIFSAIEG